MSTTDEHAGLVTKTGRITVQDCGHLDHCWQETLARWLVAPILIPAAISTNFSPANCSTETEPKK
jgi:hypothetical protein